MITLTLSDRHRRQFDANSPTLQRPTAHFRPNRPDIKHCGVKSAKGKNTRKPAAHCMKILYLRGKYVF